MKNCDKTIFNPYLSLLVMPSTPSWVRVPASKASASDMASFLYAVKINNFDHVKQALANDPAWPKLARDNYGEGALRVATSVEMFALLVPLSDVNERSSAVRRVLYMYFPLLLRILFVCFIEMLPIPVGLNYAAHALRSARLPAICRVASEARRRPKYH